MLNRVWVIKHQSYQIRGTNGTEERGRNYL